MAPNSTHADYDANAAAWQRARDVLLGEDAVKAAGVRYLARLEAQTETDYTAYVARGCFFGAAARTADAYLGLVFRRPAYVKLPETSSPVGKSLAEFSRDAAEDILNWRVERVGGRNLLTLVVLFEPGAGPAEPGSDEFQKIGADQIRALHLTSNSGGPTCRVDIWRRGGASSKTQSATSDGWQLADSHVPRRLGRPLPRIPFVFHCPPSST